MNIDIEIPFSTDRYEKRLIILIDILGFKEYIISNYSTGDIKGIKEYVAYFQDQVSDGFKQIKGKSHSFKPTFNFFSDTIIISLPLELFNAPDKYKSFTSSETPDIQINLDKMRLLQIATLLISQVQLHSIKHGLLSRGGIEVGDIYHNKNTWFGPGLISVHEHESKIAIHPRVILSNSAFEYFRNEIIADPNPSWIKDVDGYYYANYMAWLHLHISDDYIEAHEWLRKRIIDEITKHKREGNSKYLEKWKWLAGFFNKVTSEYLVPKHGATLSTIDT